MRQPKIWKLCKICKQPSPMFNAQRYCSKCRHQRAILNSKPIVTKYCKGCTAQFETTKVYKLFCNRVCRKQWEHEQYLEKKNANI